MGLWWGLSETLQILQGWKIQADNGQNIYLTHSSHSRKPNQSLCKNWPRTVRTWPSHDCQLLSCLPWLPTQDQAEKAKFALQTNPIRCPIVSPPPAFLSQQPPLRVSLKPSPFWLHSFSIPLPVFDSLPNAPGGGQPPGYSKALSK